MARRNSNARKRDKPRRLRIKAGPVLVKVERRPDDIYFGRPVAAAEWRGLDAN